MTNEFYLYRHAWISAPHFDYQLTDNQCDELLKKGGWMVRNTYDFDQKEESNFWYIIKDSFGGMEELSSNTRNQIRRAFNRLVYKKIDKKLVVDQGFEILKDVNEHYLVKDRKMNKKVFQSLLDSWHENQCEFWGAFDITTDRFVGFAVVRMFDLGCFYDMVTIYHKYKHNTSYPYYGFFYRLNEYYFGENKLKYVTDGARSITEHSNVQPFLQQKFKFRKAYCKLKIRYKWWFGIIVKLLYPFREIMPNLSVKAVLKMHDISLKNR